MDVTDVESAYLYGKSRYEAWHQEFMIQWYKPIMMQMLLSLAKGITNAPPELQAEIQKRAPGGFDQMKAIAKAKKLEV